MAPYDDAVKAAAEAEWMEEAVASTSALADTFRRRVADGSLIAAHEADAAERIAQAIDQAWVQVKDATGTDDFTAYREGYLDGLEHAEGIARTTLRQPHDPEAHT